GSWARRHLARPDRVSGQPARRAGKELCANAQGAAGQEHQHLRCAGPGFRLGGCRSVISAAAHIAPAGVYLRSCLLPFEALLSRPDVTDIYVNRPGELWIETLGGEIERHEDASLNEFALARLARQIAALTHQGVSREHPLLAATMPDGSRIQIVAPP